MAGSERGNLMDAAKIDAPDTDGALCAASLCAIIRGGINRKELVNMSTRHWGKRLVALSCVLLTLLLTGCHPLMKGEDALETKYVSATFYPLYSLAVNIVKDVPALSLSCLTQPQDGCIRSYTLSDWDYQTLMAQDAVIFGGRGLESFEGTLTQQTGGPILLSALEGANLRSETVGNSDDENTAHFRGENPWSFLSVAGAMEISIAVAGAMAVVDETFAEKYHENLTEYLARLEVLISKMSDVVARAPYRKVAVLHEGLTYFAGQFSLDMVCVYPREPGSDLIDNDLAALLAALSAAEAELVLVEEQAPASLVSAVEAAGYPVARLDTLTAHTADGDTGKYERIMLENAEALAEALKRAE